MGAGVKGRDERVEGIREEDIRKGGMEWSNDERRKGRKARGKG